VLEFLFFLFRPKSWSC